MKNKNKRFVFLFTLFLVLFPLVQANASSVPQPRIIAVRQNYPGTVTRPIVTGLTAANTEILIYLNGKFAGNAHINSKGTVTDNFYFQPTEPLATGDYSINAVAKDKSSLAQSDFSAPIAITIPELSAPTLLEPNESTVTGMVKPVIVGLTESETIVHVFVDGKINGNTGLLADPSGTAHFSYRPFLNLSVGEHSAWAVAVSEDGRISQQSNVLSFRVEEPMPAPTLFAPVVNSQSSRTQPFIVGLAKNGSLVKVYIDQQLNGQFAVTDDPTGTASFSYRPFLPLKPGNHLLYVTATDSRGKVSQWSSLMNYTVAQPAISEGAAEENVDVLSSEGVFGSRLADLLVLARLFTADRTVSVSAEQLAAIETLLRNPGNYSVSPEELEQLKALYEAQTGTTTPPAAAGEEAQPGESTSTATTTDQTTDQELEAILNQPGGTSTTATGLINESKKLAGKLSLNLIIFILFLIAVIAWIFWVNRELIKERREQSEKDKIAGNGGQEKKESDQDKFNL